MDMLKDKVQKPMSRAETVALFLTAFAPDDVLMGVKKYLAERCDDDDCMGWQIKDAPPTFKGIDSMLIEGRYYWRVNPPMIDKHEWDEFHQGKRVEHTVQQSVHMECKVCGSKMIPSRVSVPCAKSNPNGWRTVFVCEHNDCANHHYDKKTLEEILLHVKGHRASAVRHAAQSGGSNFRKRVGRGKR